MAAAVAWTYNGSTTIVAVCTGLLPSTSYDLLSNDPASSGDTATSDGSGNLTLTISDIGGMSAGQTQFAEVGRHLFSVGPTDYVSAIIFKFGTPSTTDQGITPVVWRYHGRNRR